LLIRWENPSPAKRLNSRKPSDKGKSNQFIKICQNTPQLCWGDEWRTLSPGGGEGTPRGVIKNTPQGKGEGEMI
jgi:hypothetical protein